MRTYTHTWVYFDTPPRHGLPPLADGDPYLVRTADGRRLGEGRMNGRPERAERPTIPVPAEPRPDGRGAYESACAGPKAC